MVLVTILIRNLMDPNKMGPMKVQANCARKTLKFLPNTKSWYTGGWRSVNIATELLRSGKIIAIPTDTIYGLAGLATDTDAIEKIYTIKKRSTMKPLAICLADITEIKQWAYDEELPDGLTDALLPGPTTIVLRRKTSLNPSLNPGVENVGIRIPNFDFVRSTVKLLQQPIALTSANESNHESSLHPLEFEVLWPQIDGIFYERMESTNLPNSWRRGSSVIDLTKKGEFKILRRGISFPQTYKILKDFGLIDTSCDRVKNETIAKVTEDEIDECIHNDVERSFL